MEMLFPLVMGVLLFGAAILETFSRPDEETSHSPDFPGGDNDE